MHLKSMHLKPMHIKPTHIKPTRLYHPLQSLMLKNSAFENQALKHQDHTFTAHCLKSQQPVSMMRLGWHKWLGSTLLGLALLMSGASMAQDNDPLSQYADDAATTSKVKAALVGDQMLSALDIQVQSDDLGAVHLSGTARSSAEVSHATTVARGVSGVVSVQNDIIVDSKANPAERKRSPSLE